VQITKANDTASLPPEFNKLILLASGWFQHWTFAWTLTRTRWSVEHTTARLWYNAESIISLIILHYLGFHAGFKEILPQMKAPRESKHFVSFCMCSGGIRRSLSPRGAHLLALFSFPHQSAGSWHKEETVHMLLSHLQLFKELK
jgi:hypothetical protein